MMGSTHGKSPGFDGEDTFTYRQRMVLRVYQQYQASTYGCLGVTSATIPPLREFNRQRSDRNRQVATSVGYGSLFYSCFVNCNNMDNRWNDLCLVVKQWWLLMPLATAGLWAGIEPGIAAVGDTSIRWNSTLDTTNLVGAWMWQPV